jgi:hypothetical protein
MIRFYWRKFLSFYFKMFFYLILDLWEYKSVSFLGITFFAFSLFLPIRLIFLFNFEMSFFKVYVSV